jgi:NADH-quinone oxidoreductase subunit G
MPGWNSNQVITKFQDEINGHLRGGDPGVRLFESRTDAGYLTLEPGPGREQGLRVLPLYNIFGSEELSAKSAAVAERMPANYVALNARELERLGLQEGQSVRLSCNGVSFSLPAQLDDSLPEGGVGLPQGLPGMPFIAGTHLRVEKA